MFKRWQLSSIDIVLVVVLVVGAIASLSLSRVNGKIEQEKASLETRARAAEINLRELEQLTSSSASSSGKSLPSEAEAVAVASQFLQYAKENSIAVIGWDFGYTTVALEAREYAAIKHNINVQGTIDALISFIGALSHAPVAPAVKKIGIARVEGEENIWQVKLELLVYYSQG